MWWIIFFHRIHRISYIILPQNSMRWIFVRNAVNFAVNFCKKCGEMQWNIYFHRNHHISYKNSPHSPHLLQKFTQKPRPGYESWLLHQFNDWLLSWGWGYISVFISIINTLKLAFPQKHLILHASTFMKWVYFSKLKRFVQSEYYSLLRWFRAHVRLIRGDF